MTAEEKSKLQEKLSRRLRQYNNLMETVRDLGKEQADLDSDPETIRLREAYRAKKKEIDILARQAEALSLQAKALKKEIDEMTWQLKHNK